MEPLNWFIHLSPQKSPDSRQLNITTSRTGPGALRAHDPQVHDGEVGGDRSGNSGRVPVCSHLLGDFCKAMEEVGHRGGDVDTEKA